MEIGIKRDEYLNGEVVYLLSEYQGYALVDGYPDVIEEAEEVLPETYKLTSFYSYKAVIQHLYYDLVDHPYESLTEWLNTQLAENLDKMLIKLEEIGTTIYMMGEE